MPVVWHDAVRQESHGDSRTDLPQHPLKRGIVTVALEQRPARVRPIEHVIDHIG